MLPPFAAVARWSRRALRPVLLADQDRNAWDHAAITEGAALVRETLNGRPPGRFALMAAIAAVHAEAPSWQATDWAEIVDLYASSCRSGPHPWSR